jgi:Tol biopolymer transport system component
VWRNVKRQYVYIKVHGCARKHVYLFSGSTTVIQKMLKVLAALLATAATAATVGIAAAAPVKVSGTMVTGGNVDVSQFAVAPGSVKRAIFVADRETNGLTELWSTPVTGGTTVKLSGTVTAGAAGVVSMKVSPDGNWVAFVTTKTASASQQLWLVANDGTAAAPAAVSGPLISTNSITDYQWSANSLRIVFRAARDVAGQIELFSKPLSGAVIDLSTLPAIDRSVTSMQISPDSSRVVFVADRDVNDVDELYSVPITGGTVTKLSGATIATANVFTAFLISANSSRVVFLADRTTDNLFELFSNSLDGATGLVKLSGTLLGTGGVSNFRVTPDGARVVYRATQDTAGVAEIYGASATAAGTSIKLSGTLVSGGSITGSLELTANGERVVFLANKDNASLRELYSAPVNAANAVIKISEATSPDFAAFGFALCPNSACVLYSAFPVITGSPSKLIATTSTAPMIVDLTAPVGAIGGFASSIGPTTYTSFGLNITPDSRRALLADARNTPGKKELFSIPVNAAAPVAISGDSMAGAGVSGLSVSADSSVVLFSASKDTAGVSELYAVALDASGAILDIDGDGVVLPTTDGLMLTRWQLGIRGAALFGGITFSASATRTSVTAIEDHLRRLSETALGW